VDVVLRKYNSKRGFNIVSINCDQEFHPIMERVADDLDVEMNYATTDEHVPEAERNNRTIKERVHAIYNSMPYSKIPHVMIRYLVLYVTRMLNQFPAKGGVSPYFSPQAIVTGEISVSTVRTRQPQYLEITRTLLYYK
jgi:hypothetical protein